MLDERAVDGTCPVCHSSFDDQPALLYKVVVQVGIRQDTIKIDKFSDDR